MATVTGQRGTANVASQQRYIDMSEGIDLLEPESSPLTILSKRADQKATGDPKFQWEEDTLEPRFDAVNDATPPNAAATAVTVDNGAYFAQHDLVLVTRTGEVFRVVSVSGNDLTEIVRGVGSTAADFADNDELYIIGSAQPEGDTSKPARSSNPANAYNFTQIFRMPWHATGTWRASRNATRPKDWNHQANKKGIEHAKDIELSLLLGQRSEDTSGSQPRRTTKGALNYITTNVTDAGGTLTETEWDAAMRQAFRYGPKRKVALGSALALSVLNGYAKGKLETRQDDTTYGLNVSTFVSPFGRVEFVTHWLLEGTEYGGYVAILDFDEIVYRYLANEDESRNTHIRENIQARDEDGRKDEYLTECGLQLGQEKRHALITGITG